MNPSEPYTFDENTNEIVVDWNKCYSLSPKEIAAYGDESGQKPLRKFYRRVYNRLSNAQRAWLRLPEPCETTELDYGRDLTPYVAVDWNKRERDLEYRGSICFLRDAQAASGATSSNLNAVADEICKKFRSVRSNVSVAFETTSEVAGNSYSLMIALRTFTLILEIYFPDDVVGTGCWDDAEKIFKVVDARTIADKIMVAARFGFKKFLVVKGQKYRLSESEEYEKPDELLAALKSKGYVFPDDFQIVELPTDPYIACILATPYLFQDENDDAIDRLGYLVVEYGKHYGANVRYREDGKMEKFFAPLIKEPIAPRIRAIALITLIGEAQHRGKRKDIVEYSEMLNQLPNFDAYFVSESYGYLDTEIVYQRYFQLATDAIDSGYWNDDEERNDNAFGVGEGLIKVHNRYARQGRSLRDWQYRAAYTSYAQTAQRKLFSARVETDLTKSRALALDALYYLLYFHKQWDRVFNYAEKNRIGTTNLNRCRNDLVNILYDMRRLHNGNYQNFNEFYEKEALNKLYEEKNLDASGALEYLGLKSDDVDNPFVSRFNAQSTKNKTFTKYVGGPFRGSFDLVALLKWRETIDLRFNEEEAEVYLDLADGLFDANRAVRYPWYLPYERFLLVRDLGTESQRERAHEQLEKTKAHVLDTNEDAMYSIIALRAALALGRDDYEKYGKNFKPESKLKELFDFLVEHKEEIDFRAPY